MPYQTGTETTFAALKTTIETFATSNGWVNTAGVLNKGQSNIKLEVVTHVNVSNNDTLVISGANSVDFLTEPSTYNRCLYIPPASFPLTYYLFVHTSPDILVCVIQYESIKIQILIFGEIVKIDSSAYVGGNFFFASKRNTEPELLNSLIDFDRTILSTASGWTINHQGTASILFSEAGQPATSSNSLGHPIVTKIDGTIWADVVNVANKIQLTETTLSSLFRSPNLSDSQAHLVPIHIDFLMESSLRGYLGYVEHLRFIRVDNYNLGDIVILGADKWKIFPWTQKDLLKRNGVGNIVQVPAKDAGLSGTIGVAIRYDGA